MALRVVYSNTMNLMCATKLPEDAVDEYPRLVAEMAVAFGRAVRFARVRRGMEQRDLADKAGLNRSYLSSIERGVRNPTLDVIVRLSRSMGMSASDLVKAAEQEHAARPSAGAATGTEQPGT